METRERTFPCGGCGAALEYSPGTAELECPYCRARNTIGGEDGEEEMRAGAEVVEAELDYVAHLAKLDSDAAREETKTIKCRSCGAEETHAEHLTAMPCPFCGSPMVATGTSVRLVRPGWLLPFGVDRERAEGLFRDWVRGLWFAPTAMKRFASVDGRLAGVYVPYWTYDCSATTAYTGQRGDDYWVTQRRSVMVNGKMQMRTQRVRRTRWRSVSGRVFDRFDDVLVVASGSLPVEYVEKLEPWDLQSLAPYRDEFLSGFGAEAYTLEMDAGFERAKERMLEVIRGSVRRDIGGDHQRIGTLRSSYDGITFKHVLLPVWLSAYRYKGKVYRFVVNGRTGEVQGERPWSGWKIAGAVAAGLLLVGIVVAVVALMSGR